MPNTWKAAMPSEGEGAVALRAGGSNLRNPPSANTCRCAQGDACTRMCYVALCLIAEEGQQSTRPSGGKWMNELWSIHPANSTEQENREETGFIGIKS